MFPRFLLSGPLFEQADPDGGNAGGGDAAHVPQDPDPNGNESQPEVNEALLNALLSKLTEAIKPLVTDSVSSAVNPAIARIDRDLKGLRKTITPPTPAINNDETQRERDLRERLEAMEATSKTEREELQAKELDAEIKTAISGLPFSDADGKQIAYDYYKGKAQRDEDGNLVIGDKALNAFISAHAPRAFDKFMQRRENVGGSGNSTNRNSAVKGFSIDQIRPGMSTEEDALARQHLANALNERNKMMR